MVSILFLFFLVHAEEIKSIPRIEVYQADDPQSCARECMRIAKQLNPKNDIPEVQQYLLNNCTDKSKRLQSGESKFNSEVLRCLSSSTEDAQAKLRKFNDYLYGGTVLEDAGNNIKGVYQSTYNFGRQLRNPGPLLRGGYEATKSVAANTYQVTLDNLKQLASSLNNKEYSEAKVKCAQDDKCRLAVARNFLMFNKRNANGEFVVGDDEVLRKTQNTHFDILLSKSISEADIAKQTCSRLKEETRQILYKKNNQQWSSDLETQLNQKIVAKNPSCPFILTETTQDEKLRGEKKPAPTYMHMWSMMDSCFGPNVAEKINDLFCKDMKALATTIAAGGVIGDSISLGVKALQAKKLLSVLQTKNAVPANHEVVSILDNLAITRTLEDGHPVYYKIAKGKTPEKISMDPSGFAINARDGVNRQLALADISAAQPSGGGKGVLMIDVNNLGKVNYFKAGAQAGDTYLGEVARIIDKKVGSQGKVYRWGGDEFVVVANVTDKAKLKELNQSISDAVSSSPVLKNLFKEEKIARSETFKLLNPPRGAVSKIKSFDELPDAFKKTLVPEEVRFAQQNFEQFRKEFVRVETKAIYESATLQPSISMGAAMTEAREASEVIKLADKQAGQVKLNYKNELGLDSSDLKKYIGRDGYIPKIEDAGATRNLSAKPIALDPE